MEEIIIEPVTYSATFDVDSGQVTAVGPSIAFKGVPNSISVENDIAEMIIEGKINISNCAVDVRNMTFELIEKKVVTKIDDVLHRVINKDWTEIDNPDIYITFDRNNQTLTFELTEEFGGTFVLPEKYQPVTKRKIIWDGETVLNFYITEYNDPNILYKKHNLLLKDLVDSKITYMNIAMPEKFSIYTRRVLKNYVLEIK
jgi:hypothetical protein